MGFNNEKRDVEMAFIIGGYCNEISGYIESAKNTLSEISENRSISIFNSNGKSYVLNYAPALSPIKELYEEYINALNRGNECFKEKVEEIMDALKIAALNPDGSYAAMTKTRANQLLEDGETIKGYASKILSVMNKTVQFLVEGVAEKGQIASSPAAIQSFIIDNSKTLDLYDVNTGIKDGFESLNEYLNFLNTALNNLSISILDLRKIRDGASPKTMSSLLENVYNKLNSMIVIKKGEESQLPMILLRANDLMLDLQSKIANEMHKRIAPISFAFERISPAIPNRQSEIVYSVQPKGNILVSRRLNFIDISKRLSQKSIATVSISTACAVQNDERDCKGQFSLSVLKEKHVITSDASALFVIDDGYSAISLPNWENVGINDFSKDDEIYFSQSALDKLRSISNIEIVVE